MSRAMVIAVERLPADTAWLSLQTCPVIAWGNSASPNADVIVATESEAETLAQKVEQSPQAALILVQLLRTSESLSVSRGLDMESLAYGCLQAGSEFQTWLSGQHSEAMPDEPGEPVLLGRDGDTLHARLNRPLSRNSITVAMRDGLCDALNVLALDQSIQTLELSGEGACFSVGGELREFGQFPDVATAHWVRTVQSPARLLAANSARVDARVHGACLGSGIELPAFAGRLRAHKRSYFQLPELQLGLIPGAGGTVSIARRIGRQRLVWMLFSGKRIKAATAHEWGLVDELYD